jgi:hypothetical protein
MVMAGRARKRKKWRPGMPEQLELFEAVFIEEFWWSLREPKRRELMYKFGIMDVKQILSNERLTIHLKTLIKLNKNRGVG